VSFLGAAAIGRNTLLWKLALILTPFRIRTRSPTSTFSASSTAAICGRPSPRRSGRRSWKSLS
jgi:hypothetical protein